MQRIFPEKQVWEKTGGMYNQGGAQYLRREERGAEDEGEGGTGK